MTIVDDIIIVTTGGTIEKTYDEGEGTLLNRESGVENALARKLRLPYTNLIFNHLFSMDSLQMELKHRQQIKQCVAGYFPQKAPIVVLHGTDSMVQTACLLFSELKEVPVAIVFTGAMKPMGFEDSDALQNLNESILAAKLLTPGVYISFHNKIFRLPHVAKNYHKKTFEVAQS